MRRHRGHLGRGGFGRSGNSARAVRTWCDAAAIGCLVLLVLLFVTPLVVSHLSPGTAYVGRGCMYLLGVWTACGPVLAVLCLLFALLGTLLSGRARQRTAAGLALLGFGVLLLLVFAGVF